MCDKTLSGVCGVFCQSCTVYIGSHEDPKRLEILADRLKCEPEDLHCSGCRSDNRSFHCRSCRFISCAESKGVDFCAECQQYPCEEILLFQKQMPHRAELLETNAIITECGQRKWYERVLKDHRCHLCDTVNSAYDKICRRCGAAPASDFFVRNHELIEEYVSMIS